MSTLRTNYLDLRGKWGSLDLRRLREQAATDCNTMVTVSDWQAAFQPTNSLGMGAILAPANAENYFIAVTMAMAPTTGDGVYCQADIWPMSGSDTYPAPGMGLQGLLSTGLFIPPQENFEVLGIILGILQLASSGTGCQFYFENIFEFQM